MKKIINYPLLLVFYGLLFYDALVISNSFVNFSEIPKQFFFYFIISALFIIYFSLLYYYKPKINFTFNLPDIFLLIYFIYIFIRFIATTSGLNFSEYLTVTVLYILIYFFSKSIFLSQKTSNSIYLNYFFLIILFICSIETCWGFFQYFKITKSYHANFKITGSFNNPAPYCNFLISLFPILLSFNLFHQNNKKLKILSFITILSILTIIIYCRNRTSWICLKYSPFFNHGLCKYKFFSFSL